MQASLNTLPLIAITSHDDRDEVRGIFLTRYIVACTRCCYAIFLFFNATFLLLKAKKAICGYFSFVVFLGELLNVRL